jgi:ABC-type transporter Mla maintaining outer membrane lipid asymmetry ATPase subunit MlaF
VAVAPALELDSPVVLVDEPSLVEGITAVLELELDELVVELELSLELDSVDPSEVPFAALILVYEPV